MSGTREFPRFRIDDLRRFATSLGCAAGLSPARATAFASYLLWFDSACWPQFGLASLPEWLRCFERGEFDLDGEGSIELEHPGTVVLDARCGLPPAVLTRAAGLASEKARDVGIGLVRIKKLGRTGPTAPVAAEIAIGPEAGLILGPGPSWTLAVPSPAGVPAVFDTRLNGDWPASAPTAASPDQTSPPGITAAPPWGLFAPGDDILVLALAVTALEPLATWLERVGVAWAGQPAWGGMLPPASFEERRRVAREGGIAVDPAAWSALVDDAGRYNATLPEPTTKPRSAR